MAFQWLGSLSDSFFHHASHPYSAVEQDQKRFWHAVQTEDIYAIGDIASRYPDAYKTWESKAGSPLQTAQAWGCLESFVELMGMGGNINMDYGNGWTPLLTVVARPDKFFMDYIIGSRPDFDAVAHDAKGRAHTALSLAIDNGDIDTVRTLIEHGANPKLEVEDKNGVKMLPADYARAKKEPKIAELIDLADEVRKMYDHRFDSYLDEQVERPPVAAPAAPAAAPLAPKP